MSDEIKALLDEYGAALEDDARKDRRGWTWIFKPLVPHARYERALRKIVERARQDGYRAGYADASGDADWTCICRCRAHGRSSCPRCLNVDRCPVHHEPLAADLRPELLLDALELARQLYETAAELWDDDGDKASWAELSTEQRLAITEACRRVVVARAQAMIRTDGAANPKS